MYGKNGLSVFLMVVFFYFFIIVFSAVINYENTESTDSNDYARITEAEYIAQLTDTSESSGNVIVTERLTFDVHAASKDNLFWELWRALPEDYEGGLTIDYDVLSVKQILDDKEIIYMESPQLYWDDEDYISEALGPYKWFHSEGPYNEYYRQYECVLFYVDGLYREEVTFEVQYIINNAAIRYGDSSELYLPMYSDEGLEHFKSVKAQILIPNNDMPKEGNYEAWTYGTNTYEFDFDKSTTKNPGFTTFSFELDEEDLQFNMHNMYIEFALVSFGDDKHSFTDYAPIGYSYNTNMLSTIYEAQEEFESGYKKAFITQKLLVIGSIIGVILTFIYTLNVDKKVKKKYKFYKPTMEMEYYRDIPSDLDPYFVAKFITIKNGNKNIDDNGYSAALLSLVRKGYVALTKIRSDYDWDNSNIKIVLNSKYFDFVNTVYQSTSSNIINVHKQPSTINKSNDTNKLLFPTMAGETISNNSKQYNLYNETKTNNIYMHLPTTNEPVVNSATFIKDEDLKNIGLEPLTVSEQLYLNLIIRHSIGGEISMSSFQTRVERDYDNTDTFVTNMEKSITNTGIGQALFDAARYSKPKDELYSKANLLIVLGIVGIVINLFFIFTMIGFAHGALMILGIIMILCSLIIKKKANKYILLTQKGEDEYAKWKGLYNFLNSESLMNEKNVIELPLWEKYLVYATAFGIAEKVVKAIEIRCPIIDTSRVLSNPYYRSSSFRRSNTSFRSATRTASGYSRSSYGGYGGYSGGRGGGTGGGGH